MTVRQAERGVLAISRSSCGERRREGDPHLPQTVEIPVGGQFGVKHQFGGCLLVAVLPERDEAQHGVGLLALEQVGQ